MPASASDPRVTQALTSMRMLLTAGLPIQKVFRNCATVAGRPWGRYFDQAAAEAEGGEDFERCMDWLKPVLPFTERAMLVIAWQSGRMDDVLPKIIRRRENLHETVRKFRSSMIQPTLTLIAAALVVPAPRLILGQISPEEYLALASMPLMVAAGVVFGVWMVIQSRAKQLCYRSLSDPAAPASFLDRALFFMPFLGKMQVYGNTAEFCDLLGNLLHSGVRVDEALKMASVGLPNGIYRERVGEMAARAREGDEIKDVLTQSSLWPVGFADIISVAEVSGSLETVLLTRSEVYREEYDRAVRAFGTVLSWTFYGAVCLYIIWHIFAIAMQYIGAIQGAIPKGMG